MSFLYSAIYWAPMIAALIDYFRRRPDWYWFFIIVFFPTIGPIIYLFVVVLPGSRVSDQVSLTLKERRRRAELEHAANTNPLPGHLSELGELLYREGKYAKAAEYLEKSIEAGIDHQEAPYYLARAYERLNRPADAIPLLIPVVKKDPKYKFGEAFLVLARCLQATGQDKDAEAAYREVLNHSSIAEARYNLALLLDKEGKTQPARVLMQQIVDDANLPGQPRFVRRRDAAHVSAAKAWLKDHPAS
ncbi:MAG: tetratricopeptide repeat protein [Deltaproteobacteria bacterium]|nr:tetratricopeptide repeat protein [Deltaproteobacteria bacterium]MCB9489405.1 tetratricopeptide repeat protein [Deltaproteobacteria bacterium]